jgi:hypothetical protein
MKPKARSIVVCIALSAFFCGCDLETRVPIHYQRFVLVQVQQPAEGCTAVVPCATVVLVLDTKTGQVCRAASLHGENYPLCLRLYESYPDDRAEVERLKGQITTDKSSDWDARPAKNRGQYTEDDLDPCPADDPLGLRSQTRCKPLPPKKGETK